MRKMSKMDLKTHPYNWSGESNHRGILMKLEYVKYLGKIKRKDVSTFYSFDPVFTYVTDNGCIETEVGENGRVYNEVEEYEDKIGKLNFRLMICFSILAVLMAILSIILFINKSEYLNWVISLTLILTADSKIMPAITKFFMRMAGDKNIESLCKFHSAEHAVINAYYDLFRLPTIEEAKRYSIFSYHCGIPELVKDGWIYLGLGVCFLFSGICFWIILFIFMIFSLWANKVNFFFTEIGFLKEPTDLEYEIAIASMKKVLEIKEESKEDFEYAINNMPGLETIRKIEESEKKFPESFRFVIENQPDGHTEI